MSKFPPLAAWNNHLVETSEDSIGFMLIACITTEQISEEILLFCAHLTFIINTKSCVDKTGGGNHEELMDPGIQAYYFIFIGPKENVCPLSR